MARISSLHVYPIKSCAGIELDSVELTPHGLAWDRHWMLVDDNRVFITQRNFPRMALIATALEDDALRVSAPGISDIEVPYAAHGQAARVTVWRSNCAAFDAGDRVASWFSEVLGQSCRLVAFDHHEARLSSPDHAGDTGATTLFSDGYAILIIGDASLNALNERLMEKGAETVPMRRFRPNITLSGVESFDEDHIGELRSDGGAVLRLVKPCARCLITTVDPATGVRDAAGEPLATLNEFRVHRDYGTIFGQNAIVIAGAGQRLSRGDTLQIEWNF